jgi:hypothetical protein
MGCRGGEEGKGMGQLLAEKPQNQQQRRTSDRWIQIPAPQRSSFGQLSANSSSCACFVRFHINTNPVLDNLTHISHHLLFAYSTGEDGAWRLGRHDIPRYSRAQEYITTPTPYFSNLT